MPIITGTSHLLRSWPCYRHQNVQSAVTIMWGLSGLIHTARRAEPNRTDSAWKTNLLYKMEAFTLHAEPNRTEHVHWLIFVFIRQPTTDSVARLKCVFFTMSANTSDCEVLVNAVHLTPALWEQSDRNYQNRDIKLKLWQEVAVECDSSCKQ